MAIIGNNFPTNSEKVTIDGEKVKEKISLMPGNNYQFLSENIFPNCYHSEYLSSNNNYLIGMLYANTIKQFCVFSINDLFKYRTFDFPFDSSNLGVNDIFFTESDNYIYLVYEKGTKTYGFFRAPNIFIYNNTEPIWEKLNDLDLNQINDFYKVTDYYIHNNIVYLLVRTRSDAHYLYSFYLDDSKGLQNKHTVDSQYLKIAGAIDNQLYIFYNQNFSKKQYYCFNILTEELSTHSLISNPIEDQSHFYIENNTIYNYKMKNNYWYNSKFSFDNNSWSTPEQTYIADYNSYVNNILKETKTKRPIFLYNENYNADGVNILQIKNAKPYSKNISQFSPFASISMHFSSSLSNNVYVFSIPKENEETIIVIIPQVEMLDGTMSGTGVGASLLCANTPITYYKTNF